ncbi:MAG: amidohydrolase [Erysipelotrichaceae bacterium]
MIKDYVITEYNYIKDLRRYFHAHPEPSLLEYNTANKIEQELDLLGIKHNRIGDTGVYAYINGSLVSNSKHTIALRSDIDALNLTDLKHVSYKSLNDGLCHACGHDSHTAVLLGAAKILVAKRNEFSGTIKLFFQQGEEIGQGAKQFINSGVVDDCERILSAHCSSLIDAGKVAITSGCVNASCDYFKIQITGKSSHVSRPDLGTDALYIASQIVVSLQAIVSRSTNPLDPVVLGIGKLIAGTQYNVIASTATIEGTFRTFNSATRTKVKELIISIATNITNSLSANINFIFKDFASPLVNDPTVCTEAINVLQTLIAQDAIITNQPLSLGSDDYSEFLLKTKGVYAYIGTRNNRLPNTKSSAHHGLFDIDEETMLISTNLYVDYALNYLKNIA